MPAMLVMCVQKRFSYAEKDGIALFLKWSFQSVIVGTAVV